MAMWENTCVDWLMAAHGAFSQSMVSLTPIDHTHTHTQKRGERECVREREGARERERET